MDSKVKTLKNVISDLHIGDSEPQSVAAAETEPVQTTLKKPEDVIITDIPLVYYNETAKTLSIEAVLDLDRKNELFGVYFSCGLVLGLNIKFNSDGSFANALKQAAELKCNGVSGRLPSKNEQVYLSLVAETEEYDRFVNTIKVLHSNGIKAACWDGSFWCCEGGSKNNGFCLELDYEERNFKRKDEENVIASRFAVFFDFDDEQKQKLADLPMDNDYLVKTELAVVYLNQQTDQLSITKGLDLGKKDYVWALQLKTGEIIELCRKYRSYEEAWGLVKDFAYHNYKGLNFISENEMNSILTTDISAVESDFNKTVETLSQYGIIADKFGGRCWLSGAKEYDSCVKYAALNQLDFWLGQSDSIDVVPPKQDDFIDRIVVQNVSHAVKTPYPIVYKFGMELLADDYLRMEYLNNVYGAMLAPRMVVKLTTNSCYYDSSIRFYGKACFKSETKLKEMDTADFNTRVMQIVNALESYGIKSETVLPHNTFKKVEADHVLFF